MRRHAVAREEGTRLVAKLRGREGRSKNFDHQDKLCALRIAHREHCAIESCLWICRRLAVLVDRPAFRDGFAFLRRDIDFAAGNLRKAHVDNKRRLALARSRKCERICAEDACLAAPGRNGGRAVAET